MGIYDRPYYQDEPRKQFAFSGRSMIVNLIIVNVAVFVIDAFLFANSDSPLRPSRLLAMRSDVLMKPWLWWKLLTYGFSHDPNSAGHIFGNMLGLYFLGQDVERRYGPKAFLSLYLTALLAGSLIWGLTELALGHQGYWLIGASGAVTTVMILFALNFPHRTVLFMMFLPMPAWVLGVILILTNLFQVPVGDGNTARIAYDVHITGALYALLYFKTEWSLGVWDLGSRFQGWRWRRSKPALKLHTGDEPYSKLDEQADAILDKLYREGQASLTARERAVLEEYSRRMQDKRR